MRIVIICLVCFFGLGAQAQKSNDELKVRTVLATQQAAWNRGDIPTFMEGYWKNDSLMFIGKSGVTYGWQHTLDNYIKGYPDTAHMGKLDFTIIQVKRLSALYFSVVGKWHLVRSVGDVGGSFTLLFRKFGKQWLIVSDHSS
jgi:hypothetical protein